jgi:HSP20 family protein
MNQLHNEMTRLFGRFASAGGEYPPLNAWEDDSAYYVEAELPGVEMSDLEIEVTGGNQLSLKGERKSPAVEKGSWHRRERGFGSFARLLDLPNQVDVDNVEARMQNGVLLIRLPKSEKARPRRIEVKAE